MRPRILVTNDDGYFADGLAALAAALEAVGEVTVVAPASEQSATAHSITLTRPLRARQMAERRYSIDGTPTDCVLLAITKILPERPDIVISGINHGANLGDDVTYSGTVAGALEASIFKLPGIAVSLTAREGDFRHAARFAADLTGRVLKEGLPPGTILNVNVPAGEIRGARFTHQGRALSEADIIEGVDPRGKQYYWIGVQKVSWNEDPESDYAAVAEGLVSVTPLRTDLTAYTLLEKLKTRSDLLPNVQS
ncbi:MAG TPA: 5'/3'-nucleotidase SurE [Blastocatellia bacterium]|nr:5'/3'-nucleotidase SurE [Blastocatellia bacterium]HMX24883.1 5'/3'-nucleotidase SurE [Blastocatellia bacterium]HMZ20019.1 5'/3'-nucleotidase SurE [Blastocatellia bacterium]HNG32815.1 5'/3'-nucleotidase SurE [Blastocatellia bacterium]